MSHIMIIVLKISLLTVVVPFVLPPTILLGVVVGKIDKFMSLINWFLKF